MSDNTNELAGSGHALISGIGQSDVGRRLPRTAIELTLDACLEAIADAGLTPADIDGISTYPGSMSTPPGFSPVGVNELRDALRLELKWFTGGMEMPAILFSIANACAAVSAGYANHVLCFRTLTEASAQQKVKGRAGVLPGLDGSLAYGRVQSDGPWGYSHWMLPFGAPSMANNIALHAQRHFHQYGTTREQLGAVALNARANAALNPKAVYRSPLSMDDYLSARMISSPLGLFDCDVPIDGSTAFIVSRADAIADLPNPPIRVMSVGGGTDSRASWDQCEDLTMVKGLKVATEMLWSATDLKPSDVDVGQIYDGFTYLTVAWLEAFGFCAEGEGGPFVSDGRIGLDGELPLNTSGGQLSAGRLNGYGLLHEACVQLWGRGGERQVSRSHSGSDTPEVTVVSTGPGSFPSCLLLARTS